MLTELVFGCPKAEEQAFLLVHLGAAGVEICSERELRCYFSGPAAAVTEFVQRVCTVGFTLVSRQEVPEKNWVAQCEAVWEPIQIGALKVVPCLDLTTVPQPKAGQILIHPGTGFGTGHHPTTRNVISLIQKLIRDQMPERILDLGTGSGILAICCAKLCNAEILACDTDPLALVNAALNVELNGLTQRVTLQSGSLDELPGHFDLIVANIYAEVLADIEPLMRTRLNPGGWIIISGIMDATRKLIDGAFCRSQWRSLSELVDGGWHALALKLVSNIK